MRFPDLFSSDTQTRDRKMQERGDPDSDENEDFIASMTPDDMRVGPRVHAPVNVGDAARRACDKRARDELRDKLRAKARVWADVHQDWQSASAGATWGAVSRHKC
jgi:hypothetical protein